jgi:hypothetical protein
MDERKPYHFMETAIRITTAADISTGRGELLADLLKVSEEVGGGIEGRHATNDLALWLGNQGDPASVIVVCDRLISALTDIRRRNVAPDPGDHFAYPTLAADR